MVVSDFGNATDLDGLGLHWKPLKEDAWLLSPC